MGTKTVLWAKSNETRCNVRLEDRNNFYPAIRCGLEKHSGSTHAGLRHRDSMIIYWNKHLFWEEGPFNIIPNFVTIPDEEVEVTIKEENKLRLILRRELSRTLSEIQQQIAELDVAAAEIGPHTTRYTVQTSNGDLMLTPLLVAKSNVMLALVYLEGMNGNSLNS